MPEGSGGLRSGGIARSQEIAVIARDRRDRVVIAAEWRSSRDDRKGSVLCPKKKNLRSSSASGSSTSRRCSGSSTRILWRSTFWWSKGTPSGSISASDDAPRNTYHCDTKARRNQGLGRE